MSVIFQINFACTYFYFTEVCLKRQSKNKVKLKNLSMLAAFVIYVLWYISSGKAFLSPNLSKNESDMKFSVSHTVLPFFKIIS